MLHQSECFHRFSKFRYRKSNKKNVIRQLSAMQTRQARLRKLRKQLDPSADELDRPLAAGDPDPRAEGGWYFIGKSQNKPVNLGHFLRTNANDPAFQVC